MHFGCAVPFRWICSDPSCSAHPLLVLQCSRQARFQLIHPKPRGGCVGGGWSLVPRAGGDCRSLRLLLKTFSLIYRKGFSVSNLSPTGRWNPYSLQVWAMQDVVQKGLWSCCRIYQQIFTWQEIFSLCSPFWGNQGEKNSPRVKNHSEVKIQTLGFPGLCFFSQMPFVHSTMLAKEQHLPPPAPLEILLSGSLENRY